MTRPLQAIVESSSQTFIGESLSHDQPHAGSIQSAESGKEARGCFDE
jgi:hypothetical protein